MAHKTTAPVWGFFEAVVCLSYRDYRESTLQSRVMDS